MQEGLDLPGEMFIIRRIKLGKWGNFKITNQRKVEYSPGRSCLIYRQSGKSVLRITEEKKVARKVDQ